MTAFSNVSIAEFEQVNVSWLAFKKVKIIDQNNGKVNLKKFHTTVIPWLLFVNNINTALLQNQCCRIDLVLLEVNLTKDEQRRRILYDTNFKFGWLHSEVINSYFSVFSKTQEKVLYCGVTEALLILHGKSFSRLWKNQPIQKDSVIIIPFNQLNITGLLSKLTCVTDLITSLILSKTILMRRVKHW